MYRLLTQPEVEEHLPVCFSYVCGEFGEEDCIPLDRLRLYRSKGVHFYQPFGDVSEKPPIIKGIAHCLLTSEAELAALQARAKAETELAPWTPDDGDAVLWVASVVSEMPGVAAKCIAGILDLIEASPHKDKIRKVAVLCTGPQGYLMSEAFGLTMDGFEYREGWPFMERTIAPNEIATLGKNLQSIWNMTKARDVVQMARRQWGENWRRQPLVTAHLRGRTP